jgi:hypothetical protein
MRNGKLVEKQYAAPLYVADEAIHVISDTMDHLRHMADGKYYDSKSQFRKATRAAGCFEIGNEVATVLKPRKPIELPRAQRREDIKRAFYEARNGNR